jgi:hypothetical protein
MEIKPEREQCRGVANEWFARSVAATPSAGKLHQPLRLLSWNTQDKELRAV